MSLVYFGWYKAEELLVSASWLNGLDVGLV